jgi:hypothetical protein
VGDDRSYRGVYVDERVPARPVEDVATTSARPNLNRLVRFTLLAAVIIGFRTLRRRRRRRL